MNEDFVDCDICGGTCYLSDYDDYDPDEDFDEDEEDEL